MSPLANYQALVARVDALCRQIGADWGEQIVCRQGCDSCCRHLTLFPVEAAALAAALHQLPEATVAALQQRARSATIDDPCPLLVAGSCQLYAARPLICRTHGLPLLIKGTDGPRVDYCAQNFAGVASLPAAAVIDLERLNSALVAINQLYLRDSQGDAMPASERIAIAAALLLRESGEK
ncbi:MAG: hypothetical protein A2091_13235 [Desulfuromonadales bacterium GWD2_61_12]|nr:MAG: hypothetical protein A2005_07005 [Desulfuromonadales bacterium GWC2_61_20]OGR34826.1 MAG: hypothetical protein A2091_13235 [Desulfuromonadales bacterium GWD2_61_12]HAD04042.1 YkgJ family cysteine cluster protein [Desulfuromonas sp.]